MNDEKMGVQISLLTTITAQLQGLVNALVDNKLTEIFKQEHKYYTLKDAVALKYGDDVSYNTVSTNYALMPCCNSHYIVSAGKRMWTKPLIEEWLEIQDKDIPSYALKYGVPLEGRIREKYEKYM